jgi:tetratricopeptide (TPR) repeat protein
LIGDLPGARFGAIAFAGEAQSFPLTSDGGAISQFFQQLTPNDMPVGGTAIARALEAGRDLFARDPLAKKHKKVLLLVTDGEDLEGDPVAVAQSAHADEITVHVVQVGGRTPEPIPEVNEAGEVLGIRRDNDGKPLTTELSAEGEAQLGKVAEVGGGRIVRSASGRTGIDLVAADLRKMMSEELSERIETVYADVYHYPLALAFILLCIEIFINETKPREKPATLPPPAKRKRRRRKAPSVTAAASVGTLLALVFVLACSRDRRSLFERDAPPVVDAIQALQGGDAGAAVSLLQGYLSTGACEKGEIGTPERVRELPNASFDLGLGLFELGERFGLRFGEELPPQDGGPTPNEKALAEQRASEVDCALRIVRLVAANASHPADFRARALYLAGNLEFLRGDYQSAVKSYDEALKVIPGLAPDAGDTIGRDAAHNRAIALRRIEEEEKRKPDAGPPDAGPPDAGQPDAGPNDAGAPEPKDAGADQPDAGQNQQPDAGPPSADGGQNQPPPPPEEPKKPPTTSQDEAILDQLEQTPNVPPPDAKSRAMRARMRGMEDK